VRGFIDLRRKSSRSVPYEQRGGGGGDGGGGGQFDGRQDVDVHQELLITK